MTTATPLALPARVPERVGGYASDDWPALPPLSTLVNKVHCMDCLEFMALLPAHSIHAIITDLPYGTTACSWDEIIPFAPMWAAVKRILKPRGVFVTTASQPFTSKLVMSNLEWFKYEWVWEKDKSTGFLNKDDRPLKAHENIQVFAPNTETYYPQKTHGNKPANAAGKRKGNSTVYHGAINNAPEYGGELDRYPRSVIKFNTVNSAHNPVHPTQKPVELYEYLVRTYTQPGELVLDITAGSGTTGVACVKTGRDFILIDSSPEYCDIAHKRIHAGFVTVDVAEGVKQPSLFELAG